ncbi:Fpg/Nei family DNA glycosylase [Gorillibacterium timonense]|uniref:Fpg/Nei family DNA glycosylase n=1 Tax=Gorillibacterium timonense TaxID=1689269 RepID=UPI00071D8D0A|nr:DNA-formamidopyrimidine glycosylase family protein [Gorillibacterium timonense]
MPELPEMETYLTGLTPRVCGHPITDTEINREKSINVPVAVWKESLIGLSVTRIERRGKHLLFHLPDEKLLLLHLMLGGWMFWGTEEEKPDRTVQVQLSFGSKHLYFIGLRLGYLHLLSDADAQHKLAALGPNPLELSAQQFRNLLLARRSTIKAAFLDQRFLSGIGNCYTDEICFHAGIRPDRRIHDLSAEEVSNLYDSMKTILTKGIASGGYMENPLYTGDRLTGGFNELCQVYDRGGERCNRCGDTIVQTELAGRKLFYSAGCQR